MLITLHCGGMPFNGTTIYERSLGGSESAAYYMAKELAAKGHKVTLFTNTQQESETEGVKYVPMGQQSEQYPLGDLFHYYATHTPTDVMIIQRNPKAFLYKWASKINLWWIHDLALYRSKGMVEDMMWNVDGVLTVSEWHKKQVCEVYGLNEDIVYPITNGVDLSLFEGEILYKPIKAVYGQKEPDSNQIALLFSSRPERGLENLVKHDGVMERLAKINSNYHLYVCAYDNITEQMRSYYEMLYQRCDELPNVTNLGALTKQELADVMRQCDMHVYPSNFEETSCITAMEDMAAGLPLIASWVGALPETTEGSGTLLIDLKDGEVDTDSFVSAIDTIGGKLKDQADKQRAKAPYYSWAKAAERLEKAIKICFIKTANNPESTVRDLIQKSDYYAAKQALSMLVNNPIAEKIKEELETCYAFTQEPVWDEHYANYYQYEKDRGVEYGPEDISNNARYRHVASLVSNLSDGSTILDYGCAHGHYTVTLAKENPEKHFIGIDITESNIRKAKKWAESEKLSNVFFILGRVENGGIVSDPGAKTIPLADCIIAAEVLEHVSDPDEHVNTLQKYLKDQGLMIVTTPYGPWEAQGYKEHWPWRAHVYHFEREDLADLWGHNQNFNIVNVPSGGTKEGDCLGSYVTSWVNNKVASGSIDYRRKLSLSAPRQTLSVCMIVKDASASIQRCLQSVMPYADELIIAFDPTCDLPTRDITIGYTQSAWPEKAFTVFEGDSPLEVGFDEARNATINKASGDWVMWIDADEYLHDGQNLMKYLRNNQYNGYAIKQHHFSMDPVGIMKTDLPIRVFRNHQDIKFNGKVHEHPEQKLNEGVGHVTVVHDLCILHDGYTDEKVRRGRFQRNIDLLVRDRKENPDRTLGKFLWLRDLAQMSQWEMEETRGQITSSMMRRADEGIELWRDLLKNKELRVVVDSLSYYSTLSQIKGHGFEMEVQLDTNNYGHAHANEVQPVHAYFNSKEDAQTLMNLVFEERTKNYEAKYQ